VIRNAIALGLILISLSAARAETPRYALAWWDGSATHAGVWFRADGPRVDDGVAIERVDALEPGVVVQPEPGRIVLSASLAQMLGVPARRPTLVRLVAPFPATASPASPVAPRHAFNPGAAEDGSPDAVARMLTRQERIQTLLAELRDIAAEASRDDAASMAQATDTHGGPASASGSFDPGSAPRRRGGLVPFGAGATP
jgi:hypothetical protein